MDGKPLQIISIHKDQNRKSTYNFKYDALYETLRNINDIEVAVYSISGPSRQGKSFLLSYLLRYLSNPNDDNWTGKDDEPLKGFEWNHGIEPETKGIWIWSKPIIVKQANGKEIAIIIMDSQGVYDEYTDLRDWSTIVGITLLTSSCFIYNVFTDIQENVLTQLETFVNYGLLAMNKDETNNHAFQRLLFLIRDWNHARDFCFGHKGGKEYITQKLLIKSNQTQASQRTRELIRKCFEDATSFLMPEIGAQRNEPEFNGSISQLNPNFVAKLEELFLFLFSPETLKPKIINGNTITGRDLIKYFEVFVDQFNGDELPQPMDLVEAVAKATDLNLIYKLKESFIFEMNKELQTNHFFSRHELEILKNRTIDDINEAFKTLRKSQNNSIVKQIMQMLETELTNAYKKIDSENEERREKTANDTITKCKNIYCESMNYFMTEKRFVKGHTFDEHSHQSKKLAIKHYAEVFGDEEIDSYAPYLLKIYKLIEENEYSFRAENNTRNFESKKINRQAMDDSITLYYNQIKTLLDENVFLTPEKFNQCEQEIRVESSELLANKCNLDEDSMKKFEELLRIRLNDVKSGLKKINKNKMKETMNNTELELNLALNFCKEKVIESLEHFTGNEDLKIIADNIKQKSIEMFENKCIVKDENFMNPYIKKLDSEIEQIFDKFYKDFESKSKDLKNFYDHCVGGAIDRSFGQIENLFEGKSLISNEELNNYKDSLISDVINKYENVPKNGKLNEIKNYVNERTAFAADLLLIDKLIEIYSERMVETLPTKIFISREELSRIHNENSENVFKIFSANKKTVDSQILNQISAQFKDNLEKILKEYYLQNEQNREKSIEEEIKNCFSLYEQNMSQTLNNVCLESNRFEELTSESKEIAMKQFFEICSEEKELIEFYTSKLKKLIDSAEDEFKTSNDINISEATIKNSHAVNYSLNYYSDKMSSTLKESLFNTKESFKRFENEVRAEANKIFIDKCKYGEKEFINKFELDLDNKIRHLKSKYKDSFHKDMEVLESEIIFKINNSLEQYNQVMYLLMDGLHSEKQFSSKHEELKANVVKEFNQKCLLKDNEYRDQKILKLEQAINDSRNQFHDRLLSQMKKSVNFYEKTINESFATYVKLMKEFLSDNTLISEEELKNLHQSVFEDILSHFEKSLGNEDDIGVIELNKRTLEMMILNEFDNILNTNRKKNKSVERLDVKNKHQIEKKFDNFIKDFESKSQDLKSLYNQIVGEAMDRCFVQIENLFVITDEELNNFRENLISDIMNKYENVPKTGKFNEIKDYVNERTASAADLLLIDTLIEIYSQKMTEKLATKIFFSREELSRIHNENSLNVFEIFNVNKKTVDSQILNQITAQFKENLEKTFEEYYSQNEQNRERYIEEEIKNSFSMYKQNMSQTLDHVCVESIGFEELNSVSKEKAMKEFADICSEEKELIEFYTSKLRKLIDCAEEEFKTSNDIKICEENSEAVNKSLKYYSDKMSSALKESLFNSKEYFIRYEIEVRDEANKIFANSYIDDCEYGEFKLFNRFKVQLDSKLKLMKSEYEDFLRKNAERLESENIIKINNSLEQYNQVMYLLMDGLHSEKQFSSKHEELKANVINEFKQKYLLQDNEYRDKQIVKLEKAINDSRNQFHDRLLSQMKKSGNFYEKLINESFESYANLMKELFSHNISISEDDLKDLHNNIVEDILSKFEDNFKNEDDIAVIESNRKSLAIKIMKEFDSIIRTNRMRNESNESNERSDLDLKLEIEDYVLEYGVRMQKMMPFCKSESDLLEQHSEIEGIIKEKMLTSSPFSNANNLERYLTLLEAEINKSFKDVKVIFDSNISLMNDLFY